ncbi:YcaO-like family protein [Wenjunlia tyrosinilytica]|uniref:YcaO domain-containing protein n=1 Tax=Wenjunlia tyrosinilytica TaxID=1544741 RepID=A0A918E1D4_9ACTN|nr:YcaO-like family protein [Wenjunlia tyrosinilytica]GGP00016.1 hypothetical protein GCM10012280_67790 [Wenjunlia tyrosinilytica]
MRVSDVVPDGAAASGTKKMHRDGTDRLVSPTETVERARPFFSAMGITRVANVTGLDFLGVPVVMACRPNSRSLAVSQGKGLTLDAARASAVMEASELYHAEHITLPLVLATLNEMADTVPVADVSHFVTRDGRDFPPNRTLLWIEGRELVSGEPIWLPYDVVHTDYRAASLGRYAAHTLRVTSNGLASGNHLLEATSHALCELIERDANRRWELQPSDKWSRTRLDLDSVDDAGCREILDRLAAGKLGVAVWETTTAIGIPSFTCLVAENPRHAILPLYSAEGQGCHPRREIALLRALSEAVQARLTAVSGMRDDMGRSEYHRWRDRRTLERNWTVLSRGGGIRDFRAIPTYSHASFEEDIALQIGRLRSVGIDQVIVVDLTRPEIGLPVVRAVVPGLLDNIPAPRRVDCLGRQR